MQLKASKSTNKDFFSDFLNETKRFKYQICKSFAKKIQVQWRDPSKEHPERIRKINKILFKHITNLKEITQEDKEFISNFDYDGIEFPVQGKDFSKIEVKNNIYIDLFGYEDELVFPIFVSDQKFKDSMDLLLLIDDNKSHYVYIKDFDRFMFPKTKNIKRKMVL